ncbi:MAG: hypothetical protein ABIQ27_00795 [Flavobacterium sp.]|uniref:hypothetical protein n=1 Tax=Flavobacterium sp. TaxID=239 RepID=UPI003262F5C7
MKRIIVFGLLFVLFSCQNKEVLLPQANETIVADVKEHSPIYLYFKTEEKDTLIEVDETNSASSINKVFNIDKQLPLRRVILEIKKQQANKHSEKYFVYTDTVKKATAFLPFTKVKYNLEKPDFNVVYFYLDRNDLVHFKDEVFSKNELQTFLDKQSVPASSIVFAYDKGMSFGKYIQYQFFVKHLVAPKGITINSKKEYIY